MCLLFIRYSSHAKCLCGQTSHRKPLPDAVMKCFLVFVSELYNLRIVNQVLQICTDNILISCLKIGHIKITLFHGDIYLPSSLMNVSLLCFAHGLSCLLVWMLDLIEISLPLLFCFAFLQTPSKRLSGEN